jgi:hypothetical protein
MSITASTTSIPTSIPTSISTSILRQTVSNDTDNFRDLLSTFLLDPEIQDDTVMCLISHEPLDKKSVVLPCGHSFNYAALYKEVERQKIYPKVTERPRLNDHQLRCPYCATIHDGLLPPCQGYRPRAKINSPARWALGGNVCTHVYMRGANTGNVCGQPSLCGDGRCSRHLPRPVPE